MGLNFMWPFREKLLMNELVVFSSFAKRLVFDSASIKVKHSPQFLSLFFFSGFVNFSTLLFHSLLLLTIV